MKSKWLDWTPGSEIIEKTANREPTKPTKLGSVGFEGTAPGHLSITCDSKSPSGVARESKRPETQVDTDPYAERMQAALDAINRPEYPAGMIPWLGNSRGDLYRQLTEILPEQIHYLWSTHGPLEQFEQVLKRLVETHRRACVLYRGHFQNPEGGVAETQ